jgi:hypothetical protein
VDKNDFVTEDNLEDSCIWTNDIMEEVEITNTSIDEVNVSSSVVYRITNVDKMNKTNELPGESTTLNMKFEGPGEIHNDLGSPFKDTLMDEDNDIINSDNEELVINCILEE